MTEGWGSGPGPGAIGAAEFDAAMEALAPFEPEPTVAVAVSGGPDSLALTLLLDRWVRARGGAVIGITVNHGLRAEAAEEAQQVGRWLGVRGIGHHVVSWTGKKPGAGIQAAARRARYRLLAEACAGLGALHLAVAHHADDQAETVLFRRERRSRPDGLAGMPVERSLGAARLIRPLLQWPKSALVATCAGFGQEFLTDPSNLADRHARTRLRRVLAGDDDERRALIALAGSAGAARVERAKALNAGLGVVAEVRPDGVVVFDRNGLGRSHSGIRRAALAAALRTCGGREHAPAADAVSRLDLDIHSGSFRGAALAGCAVRVWADGLLICREPGRIAPPVSLTPGDWRTWDRRFLLRIGVPGGEAGAFTAGALGAADFAQLRRTCPARLPAVAGAGLPAVRAGGRLVAVPALGWRESGAPEVEQRFAPPWSLSSERFTVVYAGLGIMFGEGCSGRRL